MATRKRPTGKKTDAVSVQARLKAAKAIELRKEGMGFPEIAKELGYNSRQAAHDAVSRGLKSILREPALELITLDLERLDALWNIQYLNAQGGDVQALAACMKIMERRAKMLGLDAPSKTDNKNENTERNGVLVIPSVMTPEDWEAAAKTQQEELTRDAG
jgi:hypothetical protein